VFVRDLSAGTTLLLSMNGAGAGSANAHSSMSISFNADGSVAAFASNGSDVAAHDTNNGRDVFVASTGALQPFLQVTVNSATWQIGTPFPQFTVSYSGFLPGDDPSVLDGSLVFSTTANQTSKVGAYPVSATGLTSTKYVVSFNPGTLTVTPALVGIDIRPTSLNIDQNGAISLVVYGSSTFDVTQISTSSLVIAGVSIDIYQSSLTDADSDGGTDLLIHFRTSDALKAALTAIYSDLLLEDDADDNQYSTRQDALITLDGAFGEFGQEFQGADSTKLFLAGNSLKTLLEALGI
jgi:hypothetical protein